MAPFGKFWTYPGNYRVQRAQAIAAMNGLTLEILPDFVMNVTNKTPEFLAKFPMGKVPAFEGADGFCLTEAQAIARYVADSGPKAGQLLGEDVKTRALIEQWSCFAEQELASSVVPSQLMVVAKIYPYDEARNKTCVANFDRAVRRVEVELKGGKQFLVGEQLTLADIMVASVLQVASTFLWNEEMRKELPHVEAYLKRVMEVPEMKQAFDGLQFCEARATYQQ